MDMDMDMDMNMDNESPGHIHPKKRKMVELYQTEEVTTSKKSKASVSTMVSAQTQLAWIFSCGHNVFIIMSLIWRRNGQSSIALRKGFHVAMMASILSLKVMAL